MTSKEYFKKLQKEIYELRETIQANGKQLTYKEIGQMKGGMSEPLVYYHYKKYKDENIT